MTDSLAEFMEKKLAEDVMPVGYQLRANGPGNEAEFRWKRAHNSKVDLLRVGYDLTAEEHSRCLALFYRACKAKGVPAFFS
jgi:hypothetical protein